MELRPLEVCTDCYTTAANGGFEMSSYPHFEEEEYLAFRAKYIAASRFGTLYAHCSNETHTPKEESPDRYALCDDPFSMSMCHWCRSPLAGTRHCATMEVEVTE